MQRREGVEPGVHLGCGRDRPPGEPNVACAGHNDGREPGRRGDCHALGILDRHRHRSARDRDQALQRLGDVELVQRDVGGRVLGGEHHLARVAHRQVGGLAVVGEQIWIGRVKAYEGLGLIAHRAKAFQPSGHGDAQRIARNHPARDGHLSLDIGADLVDRKDHVRIRDGQSPDHINSAAAIGRIGEHGDTCEIVRHNHVGRCQVAVVGDKELPHDLLLPHRISDGCDKKKQVGCIVGVVSDGLRGVHVITAALVGDAGLPGRFVGAVDVRLELDLAVALDIGA